jgi:chemotaxis protein histidine kinase CheA
MGIPQGSNIDPTLLELFRAELDAHIPVLNDGLLALERGPSEESEIAAMMRAAHSIKGAARIVGIDAAVRVAHALEDCFTAARDKHIPLASGSVDVLLKGVDALQRICTRQPDTEPSQTWLDSLLEQISAVRDGRAPRSDSAPSQSTADFPPTADQRLALPSNLDEAAAAQLRTQLCEALRQRPLRVCLDFAHVDQVSAIALGLFASFAREVAGMSPAPVLVADGMAGPVATLMRYSGLDRALSANR